MRSPLAPPPQYRLTPEDREFVARIDCDLAAERQIIYLPVDRPAVIAHFIRTACVPGNDERSRWLYGVRLARILSRHPAAEPMQLFDPRLDWEVWNAYLLVESLPESEQPEWSAWQLVLRQLWMNADLIAADPARALWWMNELLDGTRDPRRAALVFFLVSCLDTPTEADYQRQLIDARGYSYFEAKYLSSPSWPLVKLGGNKLPPEARTFSGAMSAIAATLDYPWEAWGFDADNLPSPHARRIGWPLMVQRYALDQNSWAHVGRENPPQMDAFGCSREPKSWQPRFHVAPALRGEVVLFCHNRTMLSIAREKLPDAALKLAVRAGLLKDADLPRFYARGYTALDVTVSGP